MRFGTLVAAPIAVALSLAGCTGGPEALPVPEVTAPAVGEGELLGAWTADGGNVTASVDARGAGLIVALDCTGNGTVEVRFSPGTASAFACIAGQVTSEQNRIEMPHPEPMDLTITASPAVAWGLTVTAIDL
jgi:hypothetical protein